MIEFDVDMDYLLDYDELDKVVLNDENGEHEPMEFVPKDTETAGNHSCASCPEMDNPDSYIVHLHNALEVADKGAGTCHVDALNTGDCAGYECSEYIMHCNECGHEFGHVLYNEDGDVWMSEPPNFCPNCGKKVEKVSE